MVSEKQVPPPWTEECDTNFSANYGETIPFHFSESNNVHFLSPLGLWLHVGNSARYLKSLGVPFRT
jgi:hypothetical protein